MRRVFLLPVAFGIAALGVTCHKPVVVEEPPMITLPGDPQHFHIPADISDDVEACVELDGRRSGTVCLPLSDVRRFFAGVQRVEPNE